MESDRICALTSKLFEYVKSPSLKRIRDSHSINRLAEDLLKAVDQAGSIWTKWTGPREQIAKSAAPCWIPVEDLQAYLNQLPGPPLTKTDVLQRLRAVWEEPYSYFPDEYLKASCLVLYEAEKSQARKCPRSSAPCRSTSRQRRAGLEESERKAGGGAKKTSDFESSSCSRPARTPRGSSSRVSTDSIAVGMVAPIALCGPRTSAGRFFG